MFYGLLLHISFYSLTESTLNSFENWDEEFDLDMTEEEIQMTLSRAEDLGEVLALICHIFVPTSYKVATKIK